MQKIKRWYLDKFVTAKCASDLLARRLYRHSVTYKFEWSRPWPDTLGNLGRTELMERDLTHGINGAAKFVGRSVIRVECGAGAILVETTPSVIEGAENGDLPLASESAQ